LDLSKKTQRNNGPNHRDEDPEDQCLHPNWKMPFSTVRFEDCGVVWKMIAKQKLGLCEEIFHNDLPIIVSNG
jgi:ectoine hydroxylase-related dioxygenase (phytanoyl-CoA dioxygenase family)